MLEVALQIAHLPAQRALLGLAPPGALGRPVVGLLAGRAPSLDLLRVQAALAAVRAQLGGVQRRGFHHGGELVRGAPVRGAAGAVGQQPALLTRLTAPFVQRRFADAFRGRQRGQRAVVRR